MSMIAAAAAILALTPAAAPGDLLCSALRTLPGGKFTYTLERGYSVAAEAAKPGPFVNDRGDDVAGFVCMRDDPFPEVDDVEVLQAGFILYIGGKTGDRLIELELVDGQVKSDVINGELSAGEQTRLDRVVAAMQARIDG